jgi:hypothetical protein
MFESWYLVKFNYLSPKNSEIETKIKGYEHLTDAKSMFVKLELCYQLDTQVRLRNGELIKITGAWLYQAFRFHLDEAVEAVNSGNADLLKEAHGIEIDIER